MNPFCSDKILRHSGAIADYLAGRAVAPILLELDMTNSCNHHCPRCTGGAGEQATLSRYEASNFLSQAHDYGVKAITFTGGGEPLLNPATVDIVEYAHQLGLEVGFITNGSQLDEAAARRLLVCCMWLRVSVDAASPATFLLTHGLGEPEFRRVLGNIATAVKVKRNIEADCTLGVGYLTDARTRDEMSEAAVLFRSIGIDYLQFRPFHADNAVTEMNLQTVKAQETSDFRILWSADKYSPAIERTYGYCHAAHFIGVVQADGNMPICCHYRGRPGWYIGNLKESSLRAIWEGERKASALKRLRTSCCLPHCRADGHNRRLQALVEEEPHGCFL